ncbi:hypothetical protein IWQ49_006053 [Labrenzia sp. EL_126]|nr:hypothetical protein [Labrenzia sp. EL_126]
MSERDGPTKSEEMVYGRDDKSLDRSAAQFVAFNQLSANFAILAVRSSFLLNGAALFALPPVLISFSRNGGSLLVNDLYWPASFFVFGVLFAGFCCFVAYLNYQIIAESEHSRQRLEYVKWHIQHNYEHYLAIQEYFDDVVSEHQPITDRATKWAFRTAWAGVTFAVGSFLCFFEGCRRAGAVLLSL